MPRRRLPAFAAFAAIGAAVRALRAALVPLALAAGCGAAPARLGEDVPRVEGDAANLLWIAVDGLGQDDLDAMPWTRTWAADTLRLQRVSAPSPARDDALEEALAGRLRPGRVADAPRLADAWRSYGIVPLGVLQGAAVAGTAPLQGFVAAASASGAPSEAVRAARGVLGRVPGRRFALVVELPADAAPAALDDAIRVLVGLVTERRAERPTVVMLSGLTGDAHDGDVAPTPAAVGTVAWLALPDKGYAHARTVQTDLGVVDLLPTLTYHATRAWNEVSDGVIVERRFLDADLLARMAGGGVVMAGDTITCPRYHLTVPGMVVPSVGTRDGVAVRVARKEAYATVLPVEGGTPALYDEIADPFWVHDLVARDVVTCEGIPAKDRAAALLGAADARLAKSAEDAGRVLREVTFPLGPPRALYPDPLEGLVER